MNKTIADIMWIRRASKSKGACARCFVAPCPRGQCGRQPRDSAARRPAAGSGPSEISSFAGGPEWWPSNPVLAIIRSAAGMWHRRRSDHLLPLVSAVGGEGLVLVPVHAFDGDGLRAGAELAAARPLGDPC